jgi:hypothetical protein
MIASLLCCLPRIRQFESFVPYDVEYVPEVFVSAANGTMPVLDCLETVKFFDWCEYDAEYGWGVEILEPLMMLPSVRHIVGWKMADISGPEWIRDFPLAQSSLTRLDLACC